MSSWVTLPVSKQEEEEEEETLPPTHQRIAAMSTSVPVVNGSANQPVTHANVLLGSRPPVARKLTKNGAAILHGKIFFTCIDSHPKFQLQSSLRKMAASFVNPATKRRRSLPQKSGYAGILALPVASLLTAYVQLKTHYEEMTAAKVQAWFRRHRTQSSPRVPSQHVSEPATTLPLPGSSASSTTQDPVSSFNFRYWTQVSVPPAGFAQVAPPTPLPVLNSSQTQILEALIRANSDGADTTQIAAWSSGLNVDPKVVEEYVRNRDQLKRTPSLPPTPISPAIPQQRATWLQPGSQSSADKLAQTSVNCPQRLPTPADTVSSAGSPPVSHTSVPAKGQVPSSNSPAPSPADFASSPDAMDVDMELPSAPSDPPLPAVNPGMRFVDPILKGIVEGLRDALKAQPSAPLASALPKSVADLDALWAPFESSLNKLAETLAPQRAPTG